MPSTKRMGSRSRCSTPRSKPALPLLPKASMRLAWRWPPCSLARSSPQPDRQRGLKGPKYAIPDSHRAAVRCRLVDRGCIASDGALRAGDRGYSWDGHLRWVSGVELAAYEGRNHADGRPDRGIVPEWKVGDSMTTGESQRATTLAELDTEMARLVTESGYSAGLKFIPDPRT